MKFVFQTAGAAACFQIATLQLSSNSTAGFAVYFGVVLALHALRPTPNQEEQETK